MSTFSDVQHQAQERGKDVAQRAEEMPNSMYFGLVLGSIALSALLFMMGKRNLGIFVGLWPPTILNMALFMKQFRPSSEMEQGPGRQMREGMERMESYSATP